MNFLAGQDEVCEADFCKRLNDTDEESQTSQNRSQTFRVRIPILALGKVGGPDPTRPV